MSSKMITICFILIAILLLFVLPIVLPNNTILFWIRVAFAAYIFINIIGDWHERKKKR